MKKTIRFLSVALAVLMLVSALPLTIINASAAAITAGTPYAVTLKTSPVTLTFTPTNTNWYEFYATGDWDTFATLYNASGEDIAWGDDDDDLNFYFKTKLTAGVTYSLEIDAYKLDSETAKFNVYVNESNGIESIKISKAPTNPNVISGFEEETVDCTGLQAKFTMSDGSTITWNYNSNTTIYGKPVEVMIDFDDSNKYYAEISCGTASVKYYFTTIADPVSSISYSGTPIEYYENTNGYYSEEDGTFIYNYELPQDATITVNYKDGTSITASVFDKVKETYAYDSDNQTTTPWTAGGNNYITLQYLGATTTIPVTIIPSPISNITLTSAPVREYVYGDYEEGHTVEGVYSLYPSDLTGIVLTVDLTDGTTKTYTDKDFDTKNETLDGYNYKLNTLELTATGTYEVTLNYMGRDIKYNVSVISSPIASLAVSGSPAITVYEDCYLPVFDGIQLTVNRTDGTSTTVTLNSENTEYIMNGTLKYAVNVGSDIVYIYDDNDEELGACYAFRCLGIEAKYTGITLNEARTISSITADTVTDDGDGTVVTVTYADNTQETLTLNVLVNESYDENGYEGYARTESGILYYTIEKTDETDKAVYYSLTLLGETVSAQINKLVAVGVLGDADMDGYVSIKDVTEIQKHLASLSNLSDTGVLLADTDGNGVVSITDGTYIQKHLANIDTGFSIGETFYN